MGSGVVTGFCFWVQGSGWFKTHDFRGPLFGGVFFGGYFRVMFRISRGIRMKGVFSRIIQGAYDSWSFFFIGFVVLELLLEDERA